MSQVNLVGLKLDKSKTLRNNSQRYTTKLEMLDNNVASVYAELNARNIEILTKKCVRKVLGVFER